MCVDSLQMVLFYMKGLEFEGICVLAQYDSDTKKRLYELPPSPLSHSTNKEFRSPQSPEIIRMKVERHHKSEGL